MDTDERLLGIGAVTILREWFPNGNLVGHEFECGSVQGEAGRSLKYNIKKNTWCDFATGEKGNDLISLYAANRNIEWKEAAAELDARYGFSHEKIYSKPKVSAKPKIGKQSGPMETRYEYRDAGGKLVGWVQRIDTPGEKKKIFPVKPDGTKGMFMAEGRPLYGLPALTNKESPIWVVEGEKCVDALASVDGVAVSWCGGAQAWKKTDWTPLAGKTVILWPDNDKAGIKVMQELAEHLREIGVEELLEVKPDPSWPEKYDVADLIADGGDVQASITPVPVAEPDATSSAIDEASDPSQPPGDRDAPFIPLGYDTDSNYWFMKRDTGTVLCMTATDLAGSNILKLANLEWLRGRWPNSQGNLDKQECANAIIRISEKSGLFKPSNIRGRGAWHNGETIMHLGDKLYVNGKQRDIDVYNGKVYPIGNSLPNPNDHKPANNSQAARILQICRALSWKNPTSAYYFAGWTALSPICGALEWRPHIWLTGSRGTGKTWIFQNILSHLSGPYALELKGETTEAGIRQSLGSDALPVLLDEFEAHDRGAQLRVDRILTLARQASSESAGRIIKGSVGHKAFEFSIRSMFAFASIGQGLRQSADISRITVCELGVPLSGQAFQAVQKLATDISRDDVWSLYARMIKLIPVVRDNAKTFSDAISDRFSSRRLGDQLGALLSGAYALTSTNRIEYGEACAWLDQHSIEAEADAVTESDADRCYSYLMQSLVRVETSNTTHQRALGAVIERIVDRTSETAYSIEQAEQALQNVGVKIVDRQLRVVPSSPQISKLFANTEWATNWKNILTQHELFVSNRVTTKINGQSPKAMALKIP